MILVISLIILFIIYLIKKRKDQENYNIYIINKLKSENQNYYNRLNELQSQNSQLNHNNKTLISRIKDLEKYQEIVDAKEEAKKIRETIKEKNEKAENYLLQVIKYYNESINLINKEMEEKKSKLDDKLKEALKTIEQAEYYENLILGYDKYYYLDNSCIFDELIDSYGYIDAGEQLKLAKKRVEYILENGLATTSTIENENTKRFISSFLLNSFNTKLENFYNIEIKKIKFPLLSKQIRAYFKQLNLLGNCVYTNISDDYLAAVIDEIKWTYRINDYISKRKLEDAEKREAQKEKLKAQKEIEKSILQKQKEIDELNGKIQILTSEIKNTLDESKEKEKLKQKLRIFEEKIKQLTDSQNKAKSMRELGYKAGVVYIISNKGSFGNNIYKIGVTQRYDDIECCFAPQKRVNELFSSGVPFPFDVHAFIESDDAYSLERNLHNKFCLQRLNKVNKFKEFFDVSLLEIKDYLDSLNIKVNWTLEAEVAQWKETQKINEKLKSDIEYKTNFITEWGNTPTQYEEEIFNN